MQDIHPTLTDAGTSLPHRRHHLHHQTPSSSSSAAALKCPRCDSPNTKFCYYNNYNLSQPRHFCKSCRRYWTFGGVLRNVPVGGASRKSSKRPKPKPKPKGSLSSSSSADSATTRGNGAVLDAPTEIAGFTSLTKDPGPDPEQLGFLQMEELGGAIVDPTVRVDDLLENRGSNGGVVALDWEIADQNVLGLFDQDYWTQSTTSFQQWSDNTSNNNHDYLSLFLP